MTQTAELCQPKRSGLPAVLSAIALVACTSTGPTGSSAPIEVPATPRSVADLPGTWGVSARMVGEPAEPAAPLTGREAVKQGATLGSLYPIAGGGGATVYSGGFLFPLFVAGVVLAPAGALVGAIYGAAAAADPKEAEAAQASIARALDEREPAATIGQSVIAATEARTARRLADCAEAAAPTDCALPDGRSPDVLLGLSLGEPYFEARGKIQPLLRLVQALDAAIGVPGEAEPVYRRSWLFRGTEHPYFEFAADDARLLRAELVTAREALVSKAVADILMPWTGEWHHTTVQPEGSVWTVLPPGVPVGRP